MSRIFGLGDLVKTSCCNDIKRMMVLPYTENLHGEMDVIIVHDYLVSALADSELELKVRERKLANHLFASNSYRIGEIRIRKDSEGDRKADGH